MAYIIDQQNCSCCHRCRVECPQIAITFRNDKYWIDPEKCISCGICASVCHNECISDPDAPPKEVQRHEKTVLNCDVAVIGGGAAGLACAARAAENGAKVIVLEKGKEVGGSADYAHQIKVHYSKWHQEKGLPDERDKTYEEFIRRTEGKVNPKLVRRVLDANVELFDWLIEGHDLDEDAIFDWIAENIPGDSLLAVGDEDLIKIHYHTNEPWKVLEYCATLGEIFDIVVEDMDRQSRGLEG